MLYFEQCKLFPAMMEHSPPFPLHTLHSIARGKAGSFSDLEDRIHQISILIIQSEKAEAIPLCIFRVCCCCQLLYTSHVKRRYERRRTSMRQFERRSLPLLSEESTGRKRSVFGRDFPLSLSFPPIDRCFSPRGKTDNKTSTSEE